MKTRTEIIDVAESIDEYEVEKKRQKKPCSTKYVLLDRSNQTKNRKQ